MMLHKKIVKRKANIKKTKPKKKINKVKTKKKLNVKLEQKKTKTIKEKPIQTKSVDPCKEQDKLLKKHSKNKKPLTPKQLKRVKRKILKEKKQRLIKLQEYFENNKDKLNDYMETVWCYHKNREISIILGVCMFRKFDFNKIVNHPECRKCIIYIDKYIEILDKLKEEGKIE